MKKHILILLFSLPFLLLDAQSVKRAYKSLEKYEYEKANEQFRKVLAENKNNVAANLGIALIMADEKSPYFNIIDSWEYVVLIEGKTNQLSQEDIEVIGEYFLATEVRKTSRPVKKKIDIAVSAMEDRLIKYIREENDLAACYEVLERYPDFPHYDNVVHIRNQFEYRKFEKQNTMAAYEEFIAKFPGAAQVAKAKKNRDKLAFENAKKVNSEAAFNAYLEKYPHSEYKQLAIKLRNAAAFEETKRLNTLAAFESFIASYPEALEIQEAKKTLRLLRYEHAKALRTLEAYNDFINKYPDGNYYVDIFNLKAEELGKQYVNEMNLSLFQNKWIKAYDNNGQIDERAYISSSGDGGYILAATTRLNDSAYADTWILKIDGNGNMIWDKVIGQAFEDKVIDMGTTSNGDIIVVGYTNMSQDSASKMGWMYKLGKNGAKIWNKNLGKIEIHAFDISKDNKIFLSTRSVGDTVSPGYYIQSFNEDGDKIWERSYVLPGTFNDIVFREDNSALLCGTNWICSVDKKFYLQWESQINASGALGVIDNNRNNYVIAEDSLQTTLYKYNASGSTIWKNHYPKNTSMTYIQAMALMGDIFSFHGEYNNLIINKISNSNGSVISSKTMNGKNFCSVKQDPSNSLLLISNKDLVLVNLVSMGF